MDKNSLIGFVLIGVILIGYTYMMAPNEAEVKAYETTQDSLKKVEAIATAELKKDSAELVIGKTESPVIISDSVRRISDSLRNLESSEQFGRFSQSATGTIQYLTLENEKVKFKISTQGGRPVSAELLEYTQFDGRALYLFVDDSSNF